jgi:hypothetical protein
MRAPVRVQSTLSGEVKDEGPYEVTLTIIPSSGCRQLSSGVLGVDGIDVSAPRIEHGDCHPGTPFTRKVQVRVPEAAAGFLVVHVTMILEDGREVSDSTSFELHRTGATHREAKPQGGVQVRDEKGNPVILVPSGTH